MVTHQMDGATGYPAPYAQTGQFPSLFASGGAHILDISAASLGSGNTEETDAAVTNLDIDDSLTNFYTVLNSVPPPTTMSVNVTGTETGEYFFNALIDLNMDGKWGGATGANGETEWVVQNIPVTVTAGVVTAVTSPPFAFTNGLLVPDRAWMRVALTKEQVSQDWDGTGQFSKGEIEDYPINPPIVDGKEIPMVQVACGGPYSFGTNTTIPVSCTVTNLRTVAGNFTHSVVHSPNGGTVGVAGCLPAGPLAIGAASVPSAPPNPAASVTITCTATKGNTPDTWTFKATVVDPDFFPDPFEPRFGQDETAQHFWVFSAASTEVPFEVTVTDLTSGTVNHIPGVESSFPFSATFNGPSECFQNATATFRTTSTASGSSFDVVEVLEIGPNGIANGETTVFFFDEYQVNIQSVDFPSDSGCEYFPNQNTGPNSITVPVFNP